MYTGTKKSEIQVYQINFLIYVVELFINIEN